MRVENKISRTCARTVSAPGQRASFFVVLAIACLSVSCTAETGATAEIEKPIEPEKRKDDSFYAEYALALSEHVNDGGMVTYASLKANDADLTAFARRLSTLSPADYEAWTESEKIAFWINAYNGLTLKAIIDNYPIKSSFAASLRFPKNSIRQIKGVWEKLEFPVMGRPITLNDIEHETLRKKFNEPRIHMALVCAALSCPPLRNEPFEGARLDAQLDDQTRRFLAAREKFRIDRPGQRVYLSPIFDWFGEDFVKKYRVDDGFVGHKEEDRAVLNFVSNYLSETDAEYLKTAEYKVEYLDYDWSLNERN
jgi:hypothetical protein